MQTNAPFFAPHEALYRATLEEAAAAGGALMGKLVLAAGKALRTREAAARTGYEREAAITAGKLLNSKEAELRVVYPKALREVFFEPDVGKKNSLLSMAEVHFDQLELMDEGQVHDSIAMARAKQVTGLMVDASLGDLTALICSMRGLPTVQADCNPMRPEAFVKALKNALERIDAPAPTRMEWFASMSGALGIELNALYGAWVHQLRGQGIAAAGYAMPQSTGDVRVGVSGGSESRPGVATRRDRPAAHPSAAVRREDDAVLTLDKLRRLLVGELEPVAPANRMQSFAQQFSNQYDGDSQASPPSGFGATVPAALEALSEMKQVDQVVQRLEQRREAGPDAGPADHSAVEAIRDVLRRTASNVAQALSLEVVTLMVDNMVRNPRLLEPIRGLIAELEPALLLLSLVDPRFFTDKQHPARELLQEITNRSLAYESVQSPGFVEFLTGLRQAVTPLASATIDNAEPFERALETLHEIWRMAVQHQEQEREEAVRALQHAEQRNLLAQRIAEKIAAHPDAADVPQVVIDFLCGPWAHVVAQARMAAGADFHQAEKYQSLISVLLWSANPELTRKNAAKLTRLVPLLLRTLRSGLETIQYPVSKTNEFLEILLGLHQLAFRTAAEATAQPVSTSLGAAKPAAADSARARLLEDADPWVAPQEAQASNFMEWPEVPDAQSADAAAPDIDISSEAGEGPADVLPLGTWVDLLVKGKWIRTQLTWASPHGKLFLFTSVSGATQSMTLRSRDKLIEAGHLRAVSGQAVVDGALDAVAQIAMRNSVDTTT